MVKRMDTRTIGLLLFSIIMLLLSWETNKAAAAFGGARIPGDAIRVRIVANSDTIQDQAIKRVIRDRVATVLEGSINEPKDIETARTILQEQLPVIRELVGTMLQERGFTYGYAVDFGIVDFPDKMYGATLYDAGSYEALRITLGNGNGKNWWCVLFPPLCFADAVTAEAAPTVDQTPKDNTTQAKKSAYENSKDSKKIDKVGDKDRKIMKKAASGEKDEKELESSKPEVRSFFWDKLHQFSSWVKGWF